MAKVAKLPISLRKHILKQLASLAFNPKIRLFCIISIMRLFCSVFKNILCKAVIEFICETHYSRGGTGRIALCQHWLCFIEWRQADLLRSSAQIPLDFVNILLLNLPSHGQCNAMQHNILQNYAQQVKITIFVAFLILDLSEFLWVLLPKVREKKVLNQNILYQKCQFANNWKSSKGSYYVLIFY